MAFFVRRLRSRFAFPRAPPPPPPLPNAAAAVRLSDQLGFSDLFPYLRLPGVPFSTAGTLGCKSLSSSTEEESREAKRSSGVGHLYSLFASDSAAGSPKLNGDAVGVEPHGERIGRRFTQRRRRARPTRSEDRASSVAGHPVGEVLKETEILIKRLIEEGYLKSTIFPRGLEPQEFAIDGFLRGLLMTAAERFGDDHQEIAKWLSGSSMKNVALSGCPSIERKTVLAAKRLRSFFFIQEDVICRGCAMKNKCKFVNQRVDREQKLSLADAMRVLTAYACGCSAPQALESQELRDSVGRSLREAISLSS